MVRARAGGWAAGLLAVVLVASGCGDGSGDAIPAAPTTAAAAAQLAFGAPFTFGDGIEVRAEAPRVYRTKNDYGSSVPKTVLQVPITLTNRSPGPFEPPKVRWTATFNGQPDNNLAVSEPPEVTLAGGVLLPGQSQSFDQTYPVPVQPADMVLTAEEITAPGQLSSASVFYRGTTPTAAAAATSTTRATTTTKSTKAAAPSSTRSRSSSADTGPGCGQRAVARGVFNPSCAEYQGYLDPGKAAGRAPSSGDLQTQYACEQGQLPASEC